MKALVVYDSYFGNTEKIAQSIAATLNCPAKKIQQLDKIQLNEIELLVIGSPTRKFRPTGTINRFINKLRSNTMSQIKVAVFDTRIDLEDVDSKFLSFMMKTFGYAADFIAKKLYSKGGKLVTAPKGFFVLDTEGPLKEGELDHSKIWVYDMLNRI